jgi:PAS domain S-box-containing protein
MLPHLKHRFESFLQSGPLTIAVMYLVFGLLWIFFSDTIAFTIAGKDNHFLTLSTFKGFAYVLVTAIVLYAIILFYFKKNAEEHERYRALADNSLDMIFRLSLPEGRYEYVSPASREVTGYAPEEFVHNLLMIQKIIHPAWMDYCQVAWVRLLAGDVPPVCEFQIIHKSGEIRWLNQRNTLIRDRNGKPVAIEGAVTDITDRKRAEERISLANHKLALMTDITYQDIQNKVSALRAYAEFSKNPASEEDRLSVIKKEVEVLETIHALIKKTKDYQQMGVDQSRWISLEQTIQSQFGLLSGKNGITLDCNVHRLEIYADPLFERVVFTLMDNAIKHGKTVSWISFSVLENPDGVVLVCENNGVGISREDKAYLFDRVVAGGGKFGLFFVRELLTLSGMSITETGTPAKGARFEICIPRGLYRFNDGKSSN